MGWTTKESRFDFLTGPRNVSFLPKPPDALWDLNIFFFSGYKSLFPRAVRLYTVEIKNSGSYTSTPLIYLPGVLLNETKEV